MRLLIVLLLLFPGCASELKDLSPYMTEKEIEVVGGSTLDDVKRFYFTDEAYEAIKDIPLVISSSTPAGYAAGTTFLSSCWQFITLNGVNRKIILNENKLYTNRAFADKDGILNTIRHEYIHHLDDMSRDGDADFINIDEFVKGYAACFKHPRFHGIILYVEPYSNHWFTDNFGIGIYGEHIAYTGALIAVQNSPLELKYAFRKVLRNCQ